MNPQNPNDILNAIQTLSQQMTTNLPQVTLPTLNLNLPSGSDLDAKYKEFLDRASNDPDLINYYNQLLQQAEGDTKIAQNFLEQDYQTGVRNTMANLQGSLQQLGLTFGQEQENLTDTLNKRGIALTQSDTDPNKTTYAGGGESQDELSQLNQSQALRQEAERRSAEQQVTSAGTALQKGLTSTGQQLTQTAQNLSQQKQSDIANRANTYYGFYQNQQAAQAQKALQDQQNQLLGGGTSTGSTLTDAQRHINPQTKVWDDNYYSQTGKNL